MRNAADALDIVLIWGVWVALEVQRWSWMIGRWSTQQTSCNIMKWGQCETGAGGYTLCSL